MLNFVPTLITADNMFDHLLPSGSESLYINQYVLYDNGEISGFPETWQVKGKTQTFATLSEAQDYLSAQVAEFNARNA